MSVGQVHARFNAEKMRQEDLVKQIAGIDLVTERIGRLVDKTDNFLALKGLHLCAETMLEAYEQALNELRKELYDLHQELGGEDVWGV